MPDAPELQSRTPPRVPLSVPDALVYRVGPQPGGPLYVPEWAELWKRLAKERPSDRQLPEAQKKTLIGP